MIASGTYGTNKRLARGMVGLMTGGLLLAVACPGTAAPARIGNIDREISADAITIASRCDILADGNCMFPFPNDFYTVPDRTTDTGRRLDIQQASLPRSELSGRRIDPTEWNRNDGFSPGAMILARVRGIDLERSGAASLRDPQAALAKDAPIMLIDAATLERQPIWAELDTNTVSGPDRQALIIRPAKNLAYGHRYIVVLRRLRSASGAELPAGPAFRIYRDRHPSLIKAVNDRRAHMESLFATLGKAGVARSDLYLAWDFTVASQRNLTGRLLAIRDDAFRSLGGKAPQFKVTKVTDLDPAQNPSVLRQVEGELVVPGYLRTTAHSDAEKALSAALLPTFAGRPLDKPAVQAAYRRIGDGAVHLPSFAYAAARPGPNDLPEHNPAADIHAGFICNIPRSVMRGGEVMPAHASIYGHGFFGTRREINAKNVIRMGDEHNFLFCAVNWYGFSEDDVPDAIFSFMDLSNSRSFFDMTQQGILNQLFLARAMKDPSGFAADPAFRMGAAKRSVIDTGTVYYDGNSQGGIIGGAVMAVSQDIRRGVLGVPGMNYSLLAERSADFAELSKPLYAAYPDSLDQELVLSLWQTLWDRAEADGYATGMVDGSLPGTPPHQVLLDIGYGDHQVTMASAAIEARTIGARLHCPALSPDRADTAGYVQGLACLTGKETGGSAVVLWDSGPQVEIPPFGNVPPPGGHDPHEDPRATPIARRQKAVFLTTGRIVDVCDGKPCMAAPDPDNLLPSGH